MDYAAYVEQHCPAIVQHSVVMLATDLSPNEEILALNEISSVQLSPLCILGIVGQLSPRVQPASSELFKLQYMGLLTVWSDLLAESLTPTQYDQLRKTVAGVMLRIIDDMRNYNLSGSMLAVMLFMRINLLDEISARINLDNMDLSDPHRSWPMQEYALCMGDPAAHERIARLFSMSDPQTLRRIFEATAIMIKSRKTYCTNRNALKELVTHYLKDARTTHDVNGPGPTVSHYALQLMAVL